MPAPPAGRLALLRRVHFDLLGLPPAPEEVERFAQDDRPDAYERLVDRLLASPHHGERWGRHWLDVVRYADTGGFESDYTYPNAWRYRDYVIRSFNADKPFDRFVREQVAGDEIWPDDPEAVAATALYCIGPVLPESAMIGGQLEYEWLTDAADTTGSAFLGLTFGCARCHDHKFDPITQRDYYAMQAIFAASDRPFPDPVRVARIKALNGLLSDAPVPKDLLNDPRCTLRTEGPTGFHLSHRRAAMVVHRLHRGEVGKEREAVEPAFPAALRCTDDGTGTGTGPGPDAARPDRRRVELARWLTSTGNPMVARVLVNRVWGWHFGRSIVATPNDFGAMGEAPTHPELLDWLARDLVDHGWSLKHLHRRIVLSATYRMASTAARRGRGEGPRRPAALALPPPPAGGGGRPRRDARLRGDAQSGAVRPAGRPAAGQGRVDRAVRRQGKMAGHPRPGRALPAERLPAGAADFHLSAARGLRPARGDDQLSAPAGDDRADAGPGAS